MKTYTEYAIVMHDQYVVGLGCNQKHAWEDGARYYRLSVDELKGEGNAKCIRVRISQVKPKKRKAQP